MTWKNQLYFGDNLNILREYIQDESVDLVYLDPPFNSAANYNVLFQEASGKQSAAQITAFEDTWHWTQEAENTFHETLTTAPESVTNILQALRSFLGTSDMMAYLTMMAARLLELNRVLKDTGSIYLHCDTTASHYLKILMDAAFAPTNFKNEIVWQRTNAHNTARQYGRIHDVILFYVKANNYTWNPVTTAFSAAQLGRYQEDDDGRLFTGQDLTASRPNSNSGKFEWRGTTPPANRGWGYTVEQLEAWWEQEKILTKRDGTPRMDGLKVYLDEKEGKFLQSVWTDIPRIPNTSAERLGYPTQKPEALLERIIKSSSNENDIVLDPFCGCGTTVNVAERLHRRWIGIDLTHIAITLIRSRLNDSFGSELAPYEIIGAPTDVASAEALANEGLNGRYQFQWWAVGLVGGRPAQEKKKGKDTGIDGYIYFFDDNSGQAKKIIIQVKSGNVKSGDIRDLKGVLEREHAQIGAFITLKPSTKDMRTEAVSAGFYEPQASPGSKYPKLQILTIDELLSGAKLLYPQWAGAATFKRAERQSKNHANQSKMF
jgi:site-specific DNA-methyltransferase (adenine-specific)